MVIATIIWNEKKPTKPLRLRLQARFPGLRGSVGRVVAYIIAFAIQIAILFVIALLGLVVLRMVFTAAAALLGIEARF